MTIIGEAFVKVAPDTSGFGSKVQKDVLSGISSTARQAGQVLRAGILGATVGIGAGAVAGAGIFAGFEQSLNLLQATAHATVPEMAAISAEAKKLGADMSLPATSAADAATAMTALAKGGLSAADSMAAAKGTLQLAAAATVDVSDAARISAVTLKQFHLAGTDAGKVADLLTGAVTKAGGTLDDFALGMQQAGAVAFSAGLSINDTATALDLLVKNGIQGSDAGTSLRTMLLRLTAPTKIAAKEMAALGLKVFDAKGKLLPFREVLESLAKSTANLTDKQKSQALEQIFGTDAIRAANILIGEGVKGFDNLEGAITQQGLAADIAGAKMKGLTGTLEGIKSVAETIGLDAGQILQPILQSALDATSGAIQELNVFADAAAVTFGRVSGFADIGRQAFDLVRDSIRGVEGPVAGLGLALATTFGSGLPLIGSFIPAIGLVNGAFFGMIAASSDARRAVLGFGGDMVTVAAQMAPDLLAALANIQDAAGPAFARVVDGAGEAAKILGPVLSEAVRELSGPLADVITEASKLAEEAFPRLADAASLVVRVGTSILVPALRITADLLHVLGANAEVTVPVIIGIGVAFATWKLSKAISDLGLVTKAVQVFKDELAIQKSRAILESFAGIGNGAGTMGSAVASGAAVAKAGLAGLIESLTNPVFLGFAAGALVLGGLVKGFLDSAAKARALKAEIQSLTDAIVTGGNAIQASTDHLNVFIKTNKDVAVAVAGLKNGTGDLAAALQGTDEQFNAVKAQLIGLEIASLHLSGTALDTLNGALKASAGNIDDFLQATAQGTDGAGVKVADFIKKLDGQRKVNVDAAAAAKIYTDATKGQGDSAEVAAEKIQKIEDALKGVLEATISSFNSQLSYTRAVQSATDAAKSLTDAQALMKLTGAAGADTQRKLTDLSLSAAEALDSQAQAAVRNADDVSKSTTKVGLTASQQYAVYRNEILKAAQTSPVLADASNKLLATLDANAARSGLIADDTALQYVQGFSTGIAAGAPQGQASVAAFLKAVADKNALESGGLVAAESLTQPIVDAASKTFTDSIPAVQAAAAATGKAGADAYNTSTTSGLTDGAAAVATAAQSTATTAISGASLAALAAGFGVGVAAGDGMVNGLDSKAGDIAAAATRIARAAVSAANSALQINSPSKVFQAIGASTGEGFALGITGSGGGIAAASLAMAHAAIDPLYDYLEIASPSKKAKKAGVAVGEGVSAGLAAMLNSVGKTLDDYRKDIAAGLGEIRGLGQTAYTQMVADAVAAQTTSADFLAKMAADVTAKTKAMRDETTKAAYDLTVLQRAAANLNPSDFLATLSLAVNQGVQKSQDADQQAKFDALVADEVARRLGKPLPSTTAAVTNILHVQQELFEHQMITATSFLSTLQGRLTQLDPLTDEYFAILDQINSVNSDIARAQTDAADAAKQAAQDAADTAKAAFQAQEDALDATIHREQLMYEHQLLAADVFLRDLQARQGQVEQFSDAYFSLLDEVQRVKDDQAKAVTPTAGKTLLVKIDNNGENLDEDRVVQLLNRTVRTVPDYFG